MDVSTGSLSAFLCVVFFVVACFVVGLTRQDRGFAIKGALGLAFWLVITGLVPVSGILELGTIGLITVLFGFNGTAVFTGLSAVGKRFSRLPLVALVGFQAFRLPLEMVLHEWGLAGQIPMSMTWDGQNIDVLTGIAALIAIPFVAFGSPRVRLVSAWVANTFGFVLLLNVARVAVLSSPGPQRIFGDPPLVLAFYFPFVWIVSVCVAGAMFGHVVTFRRLLAERSEGAVPAPGLASGGGVG